MKPLSPRLILALLALLAAPATAATAATGPGESLLQLLDYVAVDYPEAVDAGTVRDPAEYAEMLDFSATIATLVTRLPDGATRPALRQDAAALATLVERRAPTRDVRRLAAAMRDRVITDYAVTVTPRRPPDVRLGGRLYADSCAPCHGAAGLGDGLAAAGLDPAPTNFLDRERYLQRSPYGLYATITLGVEGTAMPAFDVLSDHERWSLAFHVGALGGAADAARAREALASPLADPTLLATLSPADAAARYGESAPGWIAWLRAHPDAVHSSRGSPIAISRARLAESVEAYRRDQREEAQRLAIAAYLEGFEPAEGALDAVNRNLRVALESELASYRSALGRRAPISEIEQFASEIDTRLARAGALLAGGDLSGTAALVSALLILLREGLEALLVVAALIAFLVKTGQTRGLPYVHAGWIAALALGVLTWWAATHLIDPGAAARELTESVAALLAAAVLFCVGFWMHGRSQAAQWQRFVRGSVEKALGTGRLWGLAGLSFVAVYREVFETILFYQALWLQTDASGRGAVVTGFACGAGALGLVGWSVLRYGTRLPLRRFFGATSVFMFVLAVVFVGKGLVALQKAGKLPVSSVPFPRIEILGVYPNLQSLSAQAAVILLAVLLTLSSRRRARALAT